METQSLLVVKLFYWSSLLVGLPSMIGSVFFGGYALLLSMQKPVTNTSANAKVSDSLVNVIVQMAGFAGKVLSVFGDIVEGIIRGLAFASFCGLVFAGMIFLTGRGLAGNAMWAKVVGSGLMLVMLLVSGLGSLTPAFGLIRLLSFVLFGLSGYSIWMIWRGVA